MFIDCSLVVAPVGVVRPVAPLEPPYGDNLFLVLFLGAIRQIRGHPTNCLDVYYVYGERQIFRLGELGGSELRRGRSSKHLIKRRTDGNVVAR